MRPRKAVVLVDSNETRLGALTLALETRCHFRVTPCSSAEVAIGKLIGGRRFEIMLAWESLVGLDGAELCATAARIDPLMRRVSLGGRAGELRRHTNAHRWLPADHSAQELFDVCVLLATRKRGPRKTAEYRELVEA